ncbi:MAG: carboxypeptidase-like regulatory domain-containing protein [Bryobacteraceae bacterium]|nr:carboxypeptidase-like regulatory domain-containing protein [Bryobacteraceae bacterium]
MKTTCWRILVVAALFALHVRAQGTTGQIVGIISDPSGGGVPGVAVKVTNEDNGSVREIESNETGAYVAPLLQPGNYRLTMTKQGFRPVSRTGIKLLVDQVLRINQELELGAMAQEVVVTATTPLLESETSAIGQVVDGAKIQSIPLNGRSAFRLVQLTPGLIASPASNGQFGDIPVNTNQDSTFSINGGRQMSNEIHIDGVPSTTGQFNTMTTIPSIEATQEFKVQSNNLSAEWGRFGGGVVNVSTRSGTNRFHGSIYEFVRNSAFDANEFFNNAAGRSIPPFRMNQFGGAVGGPVNLGKLYKGTNRTFFFGDYQGTRYRRGDTGRFSLPTAEQRNGDFSRTLTQTGALVVIYDPTTTAPDPARAGQSVRSPFPGNVLPANRIDPIARKLVSYYPLPNTAGDPFTGFNNYANNAGRSIDQNQVSGRVDHTFTPSYRVFGRFAHNRTLLTQPDSYGNVATPDPGAVGTTPFRQTTFAFDNAITLSPTSILNFKYGLARWYQFRETRSYGFDQRTLGFPDSLVRQFQIPVFPAVSVEQYGALGGQSYFSSGNDTHTLIGGWTRVMGKQTIKIGGETRLRRINFFLLGGGGGSLTFNRVFTRGPNPLQFYDNAGNGIASLLLGNPNAGSVPVVSGVSAQNFYSAGYIQTDARLTPRLTMNAGIRYESESPFTDRYNAINYFDADIPSPAKNSQFPNLRGGLVFASPESRHVWNWDRLNFAPRLGFAWSVAPKTVLRWGGGFFYAPAETSNVATAFAANDGFAANTPLVSTIDGGLTPYRTLSNPYPEGIIQPVRNSLGASTFLGQSTAVWDRTQVMPVTYQWNFDVQRELPGQILVDVAYVGSRGVHLAFKNRQMNELDPQFLSLGTALNQQVNNPFFGSINVGTLAQRTVTRRQLLLPYPQFTGVNVINMTMANSIYHSMQLKVDKRFSSGIGILFAYTAGKLISDSNNTVSNNGGAANNPANTQNWYNLRLERSLSEMDVAQNFVISFVAELPFGPGKALFPGARGLSARLIGGWQLNGITSRRGGFPLSMSATIPGGGNRPNTTGQSAEINADRSRGEAIARWFNTAAFLQPASFTLGDVGRTLPDTRGPALFNQDVSLIKNTRIKEGVQLQLRFEYFNVTNTPSFSAPNTALGSGAFGRIQTTLLLPRVGQIAAKINF